MFQMKKKKFFFCGCSNSGMKSLSFYAKKKFKTNKLDNNQDDISKFWNSFGDFTYKNLLDNNVIAQTDIDILNKWITYFAK